MPLVELLILVIVLVGVCIVAKWFVGYMGVPHPISWVVLAVVGLLCLIVLLNAVGLTDVGPRVRFR
jgi:hypothetical protein